MFESIAVVLAADEPKIASGDLVSLAATTFVLVAVLVAVVIVARRKMRSSASPPVILTPLPLPRTRTGDEDADDIRIATIRPVSTEPTLPTDPPGESGNDT